MRRYPESAVERAMKVQEVLLRAMSGQLSWVQAGEILGLCPRKVLRLRHRLATDGYAGLFDRRREPSPKRVPLETVERVGGIPDQKDNASFLHVAQTARCGDRVDSAVVQAAEEGQRPEEGVDRVGGVSRDVHGASLCPGMPGVTGPDGTCQRGWWLVPSDRSVPVGRAGAAAGAPGAAATIIMAAAADGTAAATIATTPTAARPTST